MNFVSSDPEPSMVLWLIEQGLPCAEARVLYCKWARNPDTNRPYANEAIGRRCGKSTQTIANQYRSILQKKEWMDTLDMGSCACCRHKSKCSTPASGAPYQVATVCDRYEITN